MDLAAAIREKVESKRAALADESRDLSLLRFAEQAWPIVEPKTPFQPNWHIEAIAEHLEAVWRGEIRNLLINVPPRHMKSLLVSVLFFAWGWTKEPSFRWLFSSYAQSLSTRDSVKCRRIVESAWYRQRWGHLFRLTSDQNQKTRFENDRTGYRLATSVGGSATGEGGDIVVADDPHNVKEAESDAKRSDVLLWWDEVMSTRLNDPRTGKQIIVMQRAHESDLSGHVLEQGGYVHLMLPTEFESDRRCTTPLGFSDPRKKDGELLWPERFGADEVASAKTKLGSYGYAGQHEQRPAPRGGGMFKRHWFKIVPAIPARAISTVRFWDCAGTEGGGAYTAGVRMSLDADGRVYIEHVRRGQWEDAQVNSEILQTATTDGAHVKVLEEQEPGSSGKAVVNSRRRALAKLGRSYKGIPSSGDKMIRATPLATAAEAGLVSLVQNGDGSPWIREFLDEAEKFSPGAKYKDQVDAASGAHTELVKKGRGGWW